MSEEALKVHLQSRSSSLDETERLLLNASLWHSADIHGTQRMNPLLSDAAANACLCNWRHKHVIHGWFNRNRRVLRLLNMNTWSWSTVGLFVQMFFGWFAVCRVQALITRREK